MKSAKESQASKWSYKADIFCACNCDWGCPCNFNARPTQGFCEGGWALKIKNGRCGDMVLDGLGFALMVKWPRAIHEGGGAGKVWIDSNATKEQRPVLDQIVKGKMGGRPWPIFAATVDSWLETSFTPLEWKFDGAESHFKFGDELHLTMAPMRNPVTGKEVRAKIVLPEGLTCNELNMASSETFTVFAPGLKYTWPNKMAWYGSTEHGS
jgi:hypothetical protein